jgi:NADH-quinone oxidoreductase subunit E
MVLIGRDTYEDLTAESFEKVLDAIARGETPKPGPQNGRQFSAPLGGDTTLKNIPVAASKPVSSPEPTPVAAALATTTPAATTPATGGTEEAKKPKKAKKAKQGTSDA